jgi:hypothetical protein
MGTTLNGTHCKLKALESGYCTFHLFQSSDFPRCAGITISGTRCKLKAQESGFCKLHQRRIDDLEDKLSSLELNPMKDRHVKMDTNPDHIAVENVHLEMQSVSSEKVSSVETANTTDDDIDIKQPIPKATSNENIPEMLLEWVHV